MEAVFEHFRLWLAAFLTLGIFSFLYKDNPWYKLSEAIFVVALVVIGGSGNLKGPVAGAVFVVVLPELLRFVHVPDSVAPNLRQVMYGLLLILAMRFRPKGMIGRYVFD